MYKVLIADNARQLGAELVCVLGGTYAVRLWRGEPLRALVQSWQPDVLVLDLQLHSCDAMALLRELHTLPKDFLILASTCAVPEYTLAHLGDLGVDYLLKKPCEASHLAQCIRDMLRYRRQKCINTDACDAVFDHARKLGICLHLRGSRYLRCMVQLLLENPDQLLTKELYPAVGAQFQVSGQRVERCVRTVIEKAWQNRDDEIWRKYFSSKANGAIPRPSISCFLAAILDAFYRAA